MPARSSSIREGNSPETASPRKLHAILADEARFFKAWVGNPVATGALSPSGKALARAMASQIDLSIPGPVIELGPGTGPVTQALLEHGVSPERLILIEYDPDFCKLLERKFPGVRVIQGDAYNIRDTLGDILEGPAAAVVSSLPLLNRPDEDRITLLREAFELMDPRGNFIQFTYGVFSPVPRRQRGEERVNFSAEVSAPVWRNLPPARVWTYRPASEIIRIEDERLARGLVGKIRGGAVRVKDEILERRDRIETEIRLVRDRMRIDFELRAAHLRREFEAQPAMVLLKKIGENRRRDR